MTAVRADRRVQGLLLAGSLGRGGGDLWSDLDLVVVASQPALAELYADMSAVMVPGGRRLFVLDKPRNAPSGGAYQGVLLDVGHPLPVWTDWYLWPAVTAAVPADTAVLVERRDAPLPRSQTGFIQLLDLHRARGTAAAHASDGRDRLLAVMLAAKYLARGDHCRLTRMLHRLGVAGEAPPADVLRAAVGTVAEPELGEAARFVARLVDAAATCAQVG